MLRANTLTIAQLFNTFCEDIEFAGVSIDSRNCKNMLFIAIKGSNFNGHDFIFDAINNGAKAVVSNKKINIKIPLILVDNTIKALGVIARYHKKQINPITIAITGSNGKTTTKNMLYNIFNKTAPTLKTDGNFNNHIGVPLTLLNLTPQHKFAIIELGANHLGEIKYLRDIVSPDIACVINTLDAHIGEFGNKNNLIKAKGEIYHKNSINIVNTKFLQEFIDNKILTKKDNLLYFGDDKKNNFNCLNNINLKLLGEHNKENALASIAIARSLNLDDKKIKQGLEQTTAEKGRLELIKTNNYQIINDCYNASPTSTKYALKILEEFNGEKIAILGDIAELGDNSSEIHKKIGKYAKTLSINYLFSIGDMAKNYNFIHCETDQDLIKKLYRHKNSTILFKASRIVKLENIIKQIN